MPKLRDNKKSLTDRFAPAELFVEPVEKVIICPQKPCIVSGNLL
jgi:hypothetical protein